MKKKHRVSISLDAEEASFLYELIRDTGINGPLWEHSEEEENPFTKKQRRALWRLLAMVDRARTEVSN